MGRKECCSTKIKIKAVEDYLNGLKGMNQLCNELDVNKNSIRHWVIKYKSSGAEGLIHKANNNSYSAKFKEQVVNDYLNGVGSFEKLAEKYSIPAPYTISKWVKLYNSHRELKDYDPKPEVYMANRKKTTKEKRLEIVNECLENNKDYKGIATKYDVSYSQVYSWVNKYLKDGEDGLCDKRGIHKTDEELDEVELLRRKVERLEKQLELEKDTVRILKKVEQVERRLGSQGYGKKQSMK